MLTISRLLLALGVICAHDVIALFAVQAVGDNPRPTALTAETIRAGIRDLDSDDYATRQRATRRLSESGRAAIEPLAEAAQHGSLEVVARAIRVLARMHLAEDPAMRDEAGQALAGLSRSDNRSVARRAAAALASAAQPLVHIDPAVKPAVHWPDRRSATTQQVKRAQLEVRDTVEDMLRLADDGFNPRQNMQLVERLRAAVKRLGQARMRLYQNWLTRSTESPNDD